MTIAAQPYTPPCAADPDLWASILPLDHFEAKDQCDSCPMLARCQVDLITQVRALDTSRDSADTIPTGTWAGIFITRTWIRQLRRTPALACDCGCGRDFDTARGRAIHRAERNITP